MGVEHSGAVQFQIINKHDRTKTGKMYVHKVDNADASSFCDQCHGCCAMVQGQL